MLHSTFLLVLYHCSKSTFTQESLGIWMHVSNIINQSVFKITIQMQKKYVFLAIYIIKNLSIFQYPMTCITNRSVEIFGALGIITTVLAYGIESIRATRQLMRNEVAVAIYEKFMIF